MSHPPDTLSRSATPPLARRRGGRVVAGVAGGVADHLDADVLWVRLAFAVLAPLGGLGVLAYGLLWMFVRQERADVRRIVSAAERRQAFGLIALSLAAALVAAALGSAGIGWILGPLGVVAVGAAVVWREADARGGRAAVLPTQAALPLPAAVDVSAAPAVDTQVPADGAEPQPGRWRRMARPVAVLRVLAGALFVAAGLGVFLLGNLDLGQVQFGLLAVVATLVGVAVLTIPWWLRLMRDLGEERRARIVTVERAEIAAHLHDSVLQTLALIQRQSDQPREVLRLARSQERELRGWLYGPGGYHTGPGHAPLAAGFADSLAGAAAEVEDAYAVTVRPVVVGGDLRLDDGVRALLLATREAMVNAAKHAGVDEVSVYAEIVAGPDRADGGENGAVQVFVRDRGVGFDPAAVPADRHGLADSVRARTTRHGGSVALRTAPGEGTEVHLTMPTTAPTTPATRPRQDPDAWDGSGERPMHREHIPAGGEAR